MKSRRDLSIRDIEEVFKDRPPGTEGGFKFFSVLVPLVEKQGKLHILYEVRARHMIRQPGEICFPGGEMEPGETAEECALRETWEEIGVRPEHIRILSRLDTLYTYSNFAMYCYLGVVEASALDDGKCNPDEVEETFLIPLSRLLEHSPEVYETEVVPRIPEDFPYQKVTGGKPYNWRKGRASVPVYEIGERVIWGLTARITKRFVDIIREEEARNV
ncbi:MAG: CoA pyrophosphatase [Bacillota bacterium]|nr:CoA pyrophosphatase [Bacillota bacterium]